MLGEIDILAAKIETLRTPPGDRYNQAVLTANLRSKKDMQVYLEAVLKDGRRKNNE